jgi:hypothetical protein
MLKELPSRDIPYTDNELPKRSEERQLNVDPRQRVSSIENADPKRPMP